MPQVAVALPPGLESTVVRDLERHGYPVVLRAVSADDLLAGLASMEIEWVIAGADSHYLTAGLLAACDATGVRLVAIAGDDSGRRNAADLGLREVLEATAGWRDIEALLLAGAISTGPEATRPGASGSHGVGGHGAGNRGVGGNRVGSHGAGSHRAGADSAGYDAAGYDTSGYDTSGYDGADYGAAQRGAAESGLADNGASENRGQVIAVWGPAGAPGRTTLAISIAAELAAEGYSVALADADTHSGSVAPALGLLDEAPGFAAACRLAGTDSLTIPELERVGQRYLSAHGSFWVLTGIGRPSRWPELSAERVVTAVGACRGWVDFTVLDTGSSLENDEEISSDLFSPRRNAATISALREADLVIAVGSADPVGLSRFLRAHVDLVEVVDAERVTVVMNKIRASAIGMNPSGQVEQTLQRFGGIMSPVLIPHDQPALDAAVLSGKTLRDVAGKSPARLAVSRLVSTRILPERPDAPTGRRKRSRFAPAR